MELQHLQEQTKENSAVEYVLSADKDVQEAMRLLEKHGMTYELQQLKQLCEAINALDNDVKQMDDKTAEYIRELETKNADLVKENQELEAKLTNPDFIHNIAKDAMAEVLNESRLTVRITRGVTNTVERLQERCKALKNGLLELKNGIRDNIRNLIAEFKFKGKEALYHVSEVMDVRGKLEWMRECVENGSYELTKTMNKVEATAQELDNIRSRISDLESQSGRTTANEYSYIRSALSLQSGKCKAHMTILSVFQSGLSRAGNVLDKEILAVDKLAEQVRDTQPEKETQAEPQYESEVYDAMDLA